MTDYASSRSLTREHLGVFGEPHHIEAGAGALADARTGQFDQQLIARGEVSRRRVEDDDARHHRSSPRRKRCDVPDA